MKVLIGITSKNRERILPKAIESALSQSYPHKEVWVFDDASTDNTRSLAETYPQVKWFFAEDPKGYVYARNLFMKTEGFSYFCSLDDDSWFTDNNALADAIAIMEKDSSIGALGFDMLSPDDPTPKENSASVINSNNFIGCGHIINLAAAAKVNYYIPNPGFYGGEERDLCIRLIDAGYKVIQYKGRYVWHDKTNVARNLKKQHESGVCNNLVFYYRRTPVLLVAPFLMLQLYKHIKFSIAFKQEKLLSPCISGIKKFAVWAVTKKTQREPVSVGGFKKFIRFN